MEENGILDLLNKVDIAALHFVFLPLINNKLNAWRHAWSIHRLRTIKSSPISLWISGQINCPVDEDRVEGDINNYGIDGNLNNIENEMQDARPVYEAPINNILTEDVINDLGRV